MKNEVACVAIVGLVSVSERVGGYMCVSTPYSADSYVSPRGDPHFVIVVVNQEAVTFLLKLTECKW